MGVKPLFFCETTAGSGEGSKPCLQVTFSWPIVFAVLDGESKMQYSRVCVSLCRDILLIPEGTGCERKFVFVQECVVWLWLVAALVGCHHV